MRRAPPPPALPPTALPPPTALSRRNRGFALLIVLWTLVLVAFLVLHMTASGRTEIRIANNLVANAVAAAAADGAIAEAIFNLSDPRPEQRWPLDGPPRILAVGECPVVVRLEDEASRINPNLAAPELMAALLQVLGSDPNAAQHIAAAIADWVGSSATPQTVDALQAEYRAAGLDYGPPGAPLETMDELGRVLGVTPTLYAALKPHLTLYGPAEPKPGIDPIVTAALAQLPQLGGSAPPSAPTPQDTLTVRIIAAAVGPGNAHVTRAAVVQIGSSLPQGYAVLAWGPAVD
jgi:general secretion pathway protein K